MQHRSIFWTTILFLAVCGQTLGQAPEPYPLDMFRGEITEVSTAAKSDLPAADPLIPGEMARRALIYLNGNPMPEHQWQCRFSLGPLGIPCMVPIVATNQYGIDPVSLGDTDLRMDLQYSHMREMAGIANASPAEQGVHKLVRNYLKEDGLCWCNPAAATGIPIEGVWAMPFTMQFELRSLCAEYRESKSEICRNNAKNMVRGIEDITLWKDHMAYYPGVAPWREGIYFRDGWCTEHSRQYPQFLEALVDCALTFKDDNAMKLASAYGDGILATVQEDMNELKVDPQTGSFRGHSHLHSNVFWGMAHLGAATGQEKYTRWAQLACDRMWDIGTDYGWIPEYSPDSNTNEICVLGDLVPASLYLAKTVGPYWYDRVDRMIRNTLARSQFEASPDFENLFRKLHGDISDDLLKKSLDEVRRLEGGFVSQSSMTGDWVMFPETMGTPGMYRNGIQMMGCCPPHGMQALWSWWNAALEERAEGVFVNFALTRDTAAGSLKSYAAAEGRLDIVCKKAGPWFLRVPGWTIHDNVELDHNGKKATVVFGGPDHAYVVVDQTNVGDRLTLRWPVPVFTQTVSFHGRTLKVRWTGPEVTQMLRSDPCYLPMYPALTE